MNGRVKMYLIFALLSLVSCNIHPSGRMVSLDNYKLHVKDNGTGEPTVIIEGGLCCDIATYYDTLHTLISGFTRVISYDLQE